jgi:cytoskeletal protein RodZ
MPTVAEQLRQGRESLNLTIYQVADRTKIKTEHLRSLEEGKYTAFAAPVYIRGFVRTYANLLKLDVPSIMATLNEELAGTDKFREPPNLTGSRGGFVDQTMYQLSKVNWRMVLPVFVVALVVVAGIWTIRVWRNHESKDPLSNLGPGLYEPATNSASTTLPLPSPRTNAPKKVK